MPYIIHGFPGVMAHVREQRDRLVARRAFISRYPATAAARTLTLVMRERLEGEIAVLTDLLATFEAARFVPESVDLDQALGNVRLKPSAEFAESPAQPLAPQ